MKRLLLSQLVVATLISSGCASMNLKTSVPWAKEDKPQDTRPQRMVAIWTDTVLHTAGSPSTRGFGGRLYFYDEKSKAVPVEGTLVVYGYDDSRGHEESRAPDRKFAFRPEEFVKHADTTQLGQSYSVWIPWDALGGYRSEVTLIPMFTTNKGDVVSGEQSRLILPGRERDPAGLAAGAASHAGTPGGAVRQASFVMSAGGTPHEPDRAADPRRMRTASIPMTDTLKQRLLESEAAPAQPYPFVSPQSGRMGVLRTTGGENRSLPTLQRGAPEWDSTPNPQSSAYRTPGEAWEAQRARIAAAVAEAQTAQRTVGWGLSLGPNLPGQPSSRSERMRSPVPTGAAATPVPGPAHWQPPLGSQPSGLPSAPGAFPAG